MRRKIRPIILSFFLVVVVMSTAAPALASRCTQYPYFMQPILCRF